MQRKRKRKQTRKTSSVTTRLSKLEKEVNTFKKNQELKFHEFSTALNVTNSGTIQWLTAIPQGNDNNTRDGSKVSIKSVQIEYIIDGNTANPSTDWLRVMLFRDSDSNNSKPTVAGLLETAEPLSFLNKNSRGQYQVKYNKLHILRLHYDDGTNIIPAVQHGKYNKYLLKDIITFNENTPVQGTGVGAETGHYYMLLISDVGEYSVNTNVRIRYIDN